MWNKAEKAVGLKTSTTNNSTKTEKREGSKGRGHRGHRKGQIGVIKPYYPVPQENNKVIITPEYFEDPKTLEFSLTADQSSIKRETFCLLDCEENIHFDVL